MELVVLPSIRLRRLVDGRLGITQKFLDGVSRYAQSWPGSVTVIAEEELAQNDNLDNVVVRPGDLPFQIVIQDYARIENCEPFKQASVVLASVSWRQNHISTLCRRLSIPCVYVTEYSLKTRLEIVDITTANPIVRWRRRLWERQQESRQIKAMRLAAGVQCNGTPTFESYRRISKDPLLFFDTRIEQHQLASVEALKAKAARRQRTASLRLLFSGRLIAMKGVGHLVEVARHLDRMAVDYQLVICGDGDQREAIAAQIASTPHNSSRVQLLGALDFQRELVPMVRDEIDLFLCCHLQGDPSCTYLETMSCGVPIVGFCNEAFVGVQALSEAGWVVAMNPRAMAEQVQALSKDRAQILTHALAALEFARKNTFERAFSDRVSHLVRIAQTR